MTDNPIFAVAAKAEALRAQGADVITLAAGEPQAATSAVVVEAAVKAVRDPATHSDDIHRAFDHTGTYRSILRVAPQLRGRTVVVGGVSKEHAMTGWRVGWLAAPPDIIASARLHVSRTITHVPTINQHAALAALGDPGTPAKAAHDYRRRRALLVDALNGIDGIDCPLPDGGIFAFPDASGLLRDRGWSSSADLATWLLDTAHLAVVPGEAFNAPGRVRLCFAVDDETLMTAIERLQAALAPADYEPSVQQPEVAR